MIFLIFLYTGFPLHWNEKDGVNLSQKFAPNYIKALFFFKKTAFRNLSYSKDDCIDRKKNCCRHFNKSFQEKNSVEDNEENCDIFCCTHSTNLQMLSSKVIKIVEKILILCQCVLG